MIELIAGLGMLLVVTIALVVFIVLTDVHSEVKRQRTVFYDALLREHRYWHKCEGGLGIDMLNGEIEHFSAKERLL